MAKYRKYKRVIKLRAGINKKGNLPQFVTITDGKKHEVNEGRRVDFHKGSIVAKRSWTYGLPVV